MVSQTYEFHKNPRHLYFVPTFDNMTNFIPETISSIWLLLNIPSDEWWRNLKARSRRSCLNPFVVINYWFSIRQWLIRLRVSLRMKMLIAISKMKEQCLQMLLVAHIASESSLRWDLRSYTLPISRILRIFFVQKSFSLHFQYCFWLRSLFSIFFFANIA